MSQPRNTVLITLLFIFKALNSYAQSEKDSPDLFYPDDSIHGSTLTMASGAFILGSGGPCDLSFKSSGNPQASHYSCKLCTGPEESCTNTLYTNSPFARCQIPPHYGPGSIVSMKACVYPEMAWVPGNNCGPELKEVVPPIESCQDVERSQASSSSNPSEIVKVSAMSMSSDLFNYLRIKDQCVFEDIFAYDLNRLEPIIVSLGPEFLTEAFRFTGTKLNQQELELIYKLIDEENEKQTRGAGLQLTGTEHELPLPENSKPLSTRVIDILGIGPYGRQAADLVRTVGSYGVWGIQQASRAAADEAYRTAADIFWIMGGGAGNHQEFSQSLQYVG